MGGVTGLGKALQTDLEHGLNTSAVSNDPSAVFFGGRLRLLRDGSPFRIIFLTNYSVLFNHLYVLFLRKKRHCLYVHKEELLIREYM